MRRAIFLDRDGTLIEHVEYLNRVADVSVDPSSYEALRKINRSGSLAVVVTNQSAVARGLLSVEELQEIHRNITRMFLEQGARIDAFYFCPHHPDMGTDPCKRSCGCRKPNPGMLLEAARQLGIDLSASHMVGDTLDDVEAGHRAGCRSVLVRTGHGGNEITVLERMRQASKTVAPLQYPDYVADNILCAIDWILEHDFERKPDSNH